MASALQNVCISDSNNNNSSTTQKPSFVRQTSIKRRNSENNDQDTFDDTSNKRGCATTNKMIMCPIAKFGCISELPYDNLREHYSTRIHQESLLKAIEFYVRKLHNKTSHNHCLENFDERDDQDGNDFNSEILDSINILAEGLSYLHNDNVEIQRNFVQLLNEVTNIPKQIASLKKSSEESLQVLHATQMNNDILQTDIETMKQTLLDSSSCASNDGSYIWKITGVAEKLANAISDRQVSIYSPPFYSSPTGYKMCMRLYLNGDGQARHTHLSLFFVLMRGNYDAILKWPFQYKISFSLFDQTGAQGHVIDSFRPDIKSNSFQQPRSNMNIASGIPKFIPLSTIQKENNPYIRDDCMFIRCIVDFTSMPKTCIPFVAKINPGLPLSIQQDMINTEIQKSKTTTTMAESSTIDNSKKIDN